MKRINIAITAIALFALFLNNAEAGDKQVGGLLLGSGAGALIGQAVGKDTGSTVVGATVGGVVGLMVGSELERHHGPVNQTQQVVAHSSGYRSLPRPVFRDHYRTDRYRNSHHYRYYNGGCRKVVSYERHYHRTKRVVRVVCDNGPRHHHKYYRPSRFYNRSYH